MFVCECIALLKLTRGLKSKQTKNKKTEENLFIDDGKAKQWC